MIEAAVLVEDPDAKRFLARLAPLYHQEAENCMILSAVERFAELADPPAARYLAVTADNGLLLAAHLRGGALLLSAGPEMAADVLSGGLPTDIRAISGPRRPVERLAAIMLRDPLPPQQQLLYRIEEPPAPAADVPGRRRLGTQGDIRTTQAMLDAFIAESRAPEARITAKLHIDASRLHVWDDGGVAAIAAVVGATRNSYRVGTVFTRPDRRGQGYAGALVRDLVRALLGSRSFVTLQAEEDNAVAHRLYRSIGFVPIDRQTTARILVRKED